MEQQRLSFGKQFRLIFRCFFRHAALILLMAASLAGALYLQILIYRSGMDLEHKIFLLVIELIGAAFLLYILWSTLLSKFASYRAEVIRWMKEENLLLELACNDPNTGVQMAAARSISSNDNLISLLCSTEDNDIWKTCLPRLVKQTIENGKLPIEIVTKLKAAPLGDDWLKKMICPVCYYSEYRVDSKESDGEMVYWASDNVVYERHTVTSFVCENCGHESSDSFFIPLSSLIPEEGE